MAAHQPRRILDQALSKVIKPVDFSASKSIDTESRTRAVQGAVAARGDAIRHRVSPRA
jgi:hypothetical protein